MSKWHWIWIVIVGYLIGYYFRAPGNYTVARLFPPKS